MLMIRLARFGSKKKPTYRVVVIDKERARDSRAASCASACSPASTFARNGVRNAACTASRKRPCSPNGRRSST